MKANAFHAKQVWAIDLLAHGHMTIEKIAYEIDVHKDTIMRWRRMPEFNEAVIVRAREVLKDRLPAVYEALLSEAEQGHHQHIKILLDHLDKLEERQAQTDMSTVTFTWRHSAGRGTQAINGALTSIDTPTDGGDSEESWPVTE